MELVLAQDVGGKAIRVDVRLALRVCEQVDLAMGLLKRLRHLVLLQPVAPRQYLVSGAEDGMPGGNRCRFRHIQRCIVRVNQPAIVPYGIADPLTVGEAPEQALCQTANQGMI